MNNIVMCLVTASEPKEKATSFKASTDFNHSDFKFSQNFLGLLKTLQDFRDFMELAKLHRTSKDFMVFTRLHKNGKIEDF